MTNSKSKNFFKCTFAVFLCTVIVALSCVSVFAVSSVVSVASIILKYFAEEYLEETIENMFENLKRVATDEEYNIIDACIDSLTDSIIVGQVASLGIQYSDKKNFEKIINGVSCVCPGVLSNVSVKEYTRKQVVNKMSTRKLIDYSNNINIDVELDTNLQTAINTFIKEHLDMFALADENVSDTIASAEEFENTDLSILANITLSGDYDMKIIRCGKGAFYACGTEFLKSNYSFLSNQYRTSYMSNLYYYPCLFYKIDNLIFVINYRDYKMSNDFTNFVFESACLSTTVGGNYIQYQGSSSVQIFTADGLACNIVSDSVSCGYVLKDSSSNVLSNAFTNARDCFISNFLGLDLDSSYEPSLLYLNYYPTSSTASESKTIVVNNTYDYSTTTNDVYNYDSVGTLANSSSNNNTDITTSVGTTNIYVSQNVNTNNDLADFASAIGSLDFSSVKIENFKDLLDTFDGYLVVLRNAFSVVPDYVWQILSVGIGSAIIVRIFGR